MCILTNLASKVFGFVFVKAVDVVSTVALIVLPTPPNAAGCKPLDKDLL